MGLSGELHIRLHPTAGHEDSVDCWCEPSNIFISELYGLEGMYLVVEHNDNTEMPRPLVIGYRDRDRALVGVPNDHEAPWITRLLDDVPLAGPPPSP